MKLSRTVAYAVRATLQLAQSDASTPVPCSQLAAEGKMPERFLLQILRNLVTHGILRSTRGVDGGYSLVRPPNEVSLLEVIEAIEGPLNTGEPMAEGMSSEAQARLRDALQEVTDSSRRQLESIKLSQLLKPPAIPEPPDREADQSEAGEQGTTRRQDSAEKPGPAPPSAQQRPSNPSEEEAS